MITSTRAMRNVLAAVLGLLLMAAAPAYAAGGGGGGGGPDNGGSSGSSSGGSSGGGDSGGGGAAGLDDVTCLEGYVYDRNKHVCVRAQSGILPDADLTNYAFLLAEEGRFQEAIDTLDLLENPHTAVALNYRGYATRKLGRVNEGITYYLESVAADPAYPQVREYLGEAYVIQGRIDLAREQLGVIETLCGTSCEYYVDLAEAIGATDATITQ